MQLYVQKSFKRRGTALRTLSQRNELERKKAQERAQVKPVEYALFNTILSAHETRWLNTVSKSLEDPQFCEVLKSMSYSEKQKLIDLVENTSSHIRARIESEQSDRIDEQEEDQKEEGHKYERWNVIEKLDPDTWVYKFMKTNDMHSDVVATKVEVEKLKKEKSKRKVTIKWNPINIIMKYRRLGDPFRHLYFDMDFYARAIGTHPKLMAYVHEHEEKIKKAFEVINTYSNQFPNHNRRYMLYEWLWIAKYARKEGVGKTRNMLHALDGKAGRISRKHIRDQIDSTMKFWEDFSNYAPYFFEFLNIMKHFITNDSELSEEYKKRLEQLEEDNVQDATKIVKDHLDRIAQHPYSPNNHDGKYGCQKCESFTNYYDHLKAIRKGPERLRIYHSNPNYQKEMEAFKKDSKKEKPRKKTVCYINPQNLSPDIRVKLHKQGKVSLW
jgi:hypothetical protein